METSEWRKQYFEGIKEQERVKLASNADLIEQFKNIAEKNGIILADDNFQYSPPIGIVASYPGIVELLYPDLVPDKEGLLAFNTLASKLEKRDLAHGVFFGKNCMLMADSFFRRSYRPNTNFAPRFVELFWKLDDAGIQQFIALDFDRVRINLDEGMYQELDFWYGPQFSRHIHEIPDGVVKLRPPLDLDSIDLDTFFGNTYALDIKWASKEGIKSFYAEEFKADTVTIKVDDATYFPVRYIHAEYDLSAGHFRHFDGAIHFYTSTEYYARRDTDFNHDAKNGKPIKTMSKKLFKMNGVVSIDTWIEFTSQFMTGNALVFEYFEGRYPQHVIDALVIIRSGNSS